MTERARAAERAGGLATVSFGLGEPDFGTPTAVVESVRDALTDGRVRYTAPLGLDDLRQAIAAMYAERFSVEVAPQRIVVTTGASSALLLATAATVDRDDEILLADPTYPCNRHFVRTFEGRARTIAVGADTNYQLNRNLVVENWGASTIGVLVASPSNPTGTVIDATELTAIADEVARRDGVLFVDEIYGELVYDVERSTVLSHTDDAFVINSFSKTFGMTGWRLGWLVCPEWAVDAVERLSQNLYISPPHPSQLAGLAALAPAVWAEVERRRLIFLDRRDILVAGLRDVGFGVPIVPQGAFYVYAECDRFADDSYDLAVGLIDELAVVTTPGIDFGTADAARHLRFSYTTSMEQITEGLERLSRLAPRRPS